MKYIKEFEGLRGLMAMWVVVGHWATTVGISLDPLHPKLHNAYAVDVFILLSGFAITALIESKKESYAPYIIRRFFRIFPVYLFFFIVSVVLIDFTHEAFSSAPDSFMKDNRVKIAESSIQYAPYHIVAHLFAAHSLIPDVILPDTAYAFLGQAWSISLEWQFYIIAPFVIAFIKKRQTLLSCAIALIGTGLMVLYSYVAPAGFIGRHYEFFMIGIASYYAISFLTGDRSDKVSSSLIWLAVLAISMLLLSFRSDAIIPYVIWLGVLYVVVGAYRKMDVFSILVSRALTSKPAMFLGKMSYSIYLSHMIVIVCVLTVLNRYSGISLELHALLLFCSTVPLTILLSWLTYTYIEKPFMDMGKSLAIGRQECRV